MITAENAAAMALLAQAARKRNKAAAIEEARLAAVAAVNPVTARQQRIEAQIDKLLEEMQDCDDASERVKLVNALDKLWNLLFPRAGQLKQGQSRASRGMIRPVFSTAVAPAPAPVPAATPQQVVSTADPLIVQP